MWMWLVISANVHDKGVHEDPAFEADFTSAGGRNNRNERCNV